jgi:hypothetical protein
VQCISGDNLEARKRTSKARLDPKPQRDGGRPMTMSILDIRCQTSCILDAVQIVRHTYDSIQQFSAALHSATVRICLCGGSLLHVNIARSHRMALPTLTSPDTNLEHLKCRKVDLSPQACRKLRWLCAGTVAPIQLSAFLVDVSGWCEGAGVWPASCSPITETSNGRSALPCFRPL